MTSIAPTTATPTPGPNSDTGWSVGISLSLAIVAVLAVAVVSSWFRMRAARNRRPAGTTGSADGAGTHG
jgi:hypothetical protein